MRPASGLGSRRCDYVVARLFVMAWAVGVLASLAFGLGYAYGHEAGFYRSWSLL